MTKFKIERLDHQGRGISYVDGKITFIPNTLVGEEGECVITKEYKKYNEACLLTITKNATNRVISACKYSEVCAGCNLRCLSYEDSLVFKKEKVINILNLNNINYPNIEVIKNDNPNYYRNKVTFKVVNGLIGFYKENTHDLIEIKKCFLAKNIINEVLTRLPKLKVLNGEIIVRANYNDEVLLIINSLDKITFKIDDFENIKLVGVIVNNKTIYGENYFYERLNQTLFKVSYDAFFQVNLNVASKLLQIIKNYTLEEANVLDLYSGVGSLTLMASLKALEVYSIEYGKNATINAIFNAKLNKKNNIKCFLGKTKDVLSKLEKDFQMIILDPPRSGLDKETLSSVMQSNAQKIIYVSCDIFTLARDLKVLLDKYKIDKYFLLDMFSYTKHVESLCVLNLR